VLTACKTNLITASVFAKINPLLACLQRPFDTPDTCSDFLYQLKLELNTAVFLHWAIPFFICTLYPPPPIEVPGNLGGMGGGGGL